MRFDRTGGFRWLDSSVMGSISQLATFRFCERFLTRRLDPTGRQYDQMTQAARSGVMNNVEGNERTSTSKETEMKLTNVAHASLSDAGPERVGMSARSSGAVLVTPTVEACARREWIDCHGTSDTSRPRRPIERARQTSTGID